MFGLFKKDPVAKLRKAYHKKLEEARDIQRSGDLKHYARLMEEAEQMANEIETMSKEKES